MLQSNVVGTVVLVSLLHKSRFVRLSAFDLIKELANYGTFLVCW